MTIHNAGDYGYSTEPKPQTVEIGDTFRMRFALGIAEYKILRRHREAGHFECRFDRWVTEVPEFRQGFVGTLEVFDRQRILAAMNAE